MMNAAQRQEFCVRWNSHLGSIGAAFPQLLAGQRFVDVTLACEGHQVHCHRLVLAACSSYFDAILAENPCKHPVIILPSEIKLWEIQALVDFMYKGEVNVTQAGLPQLLRCAEQLRIRGLYGTDAALNLNQLKAMTKVSAPSGGTMTGNSLTNQMTSGSELPENEDTTTNSTTTTTTTSNSASSVIQQAPNTTNASNAMMMAGVSGGVVGQQTIIKKEPDHLASNDAANVQMQNLMQQQQLQQQQHLQQQQQQHLQQQQREMLLHTAANSSVANSNAPTEDDSNEDSNSNTYEQYEEYSQTINNKAAAAAAQQQLLQMDSTIEDDHNYVAHDDDDSFGHVGSSALDTEHESSGNASMLHSSMMDSSGSYKRVRRSEASLAQAAKCVSKGQTFQTVSNMFNIPVSTIRFYMARKGILPKRKRGRGALQQSTTSSMSGSGGISNAVMSDAIAHMKRSNSPTSLEAQYHLLAAAGAANAAGALYKMNEQQAATAAGNLM